jgi:ribonuclease E
MPNKMLIDATHPEETRVVVLRGNRVEEFDFESATRKQLRGNIYLAKVTRVEPSLQAAFVDYGGNRHGFLAFSEIHPDYYQIPVADRQALIDEEERAARAADAEADHRAGRRGRHQSSRQRDEAVCSDPLAAEEMAREAAEIPAGEDVMGVSETLTAAAQPVVEREAAPAPDHAEAPAETEQAVTGETPQEAFAPAGPASEGAAPTQEGESDDANGGDDHSLDNGGEGEGEGEETAVESVGGADALEEVPERAPRGRRQYKIQEVIKRRQVMLVQVVKEERGTKGAALTTYLSLAGRYSVLMPNTARGGGISRKITNSADRKKLKEIAQDLEVPEGMGVILRTAGASRTKTEVKRDFEYLLRVWENVRDLTLKSTAAKLVYEEGSLVKRAIRDLYNKDIDEVIVAGDAAHKEAKDFMRMLMPSHAKNVKPYMDIQPLFTRYGIESQLDAMFSPTVQLRSGGYIVINQAEALVAIDVNSGRATREHHIEDTALKTNLEAAEEVARQLRMRDLAGLIVIDFIDMEEKRNNRAVERKLKECLKHDRARIQVGGISHFGLLEMSRQRIRTSVLESSTEKCTTCGGSGHVRSVASVALQLLRSLEETLLKSATHNLTVRTRSEVAIYVLNHKRAHLRNLEECFRVTLTVIADPSITGQVSFVVDRGEQVHSVEAAKALLASQPVSFLPMPEEEEAADIEDDEAEGAHEAEAGPGQDGSDQASAEAAADEAAPRRKRRRRRGRGREGHDGPRETAGPDQEGPIQPPISAERQEQENEGGADQPEPLSPERGGAPTSPENGQPRGDGDSRRRRRGRRGGRRNRRDREGSGDHAANGNDGRQFREMDANITAETQPARVEPSAGGGDSEAKEFVQRTPEAAAGPATPAPIPSSAESDATKRRSSVREPAPTFAPGQEFSPTPRAAPEPAAPSAAQEPSAEVNVAKPRKTGWWAKRLMGNKG